MIHTEIKSRLPARDVLTHFLGPARRSWRCPFHEDHIPSLSAHGPAIRCFGCQWVGDVFKFVEDYLKIGHREALHMLADMAGVILPRARPPAITIAMNQVCRESDQIERDIIRQAKLAAAQAWRKAWDERDTDRLWETVAIGAVLDRKVEMMKMEAGNE